MRLIIDTPPDFSFPETLSAHGWRRLLPFIWNEDAQTLERVEECSAGVVLLRIRAAGEQVFVEVNGEADEAEVMRRVRRMLQLDLPLDAFHAYCRTRPELASLVEFKRGRMLRCPSLWEDTVKDVCKVSWISVPKAPGAKTTSAPSLWQNTFFNSSLVLLKGASSSSVRA